MNNEIDIPGYDCFVEYLVRELIPGKEWRRDVALAWMIKALCDTGDAWFWTFTFSGKLAEYPMSGKAFRELSEAWGLFRQKLQDKTGVAGLRFYELGGKTRRFHVHALLNKRVDMRAVESCKRGTYIGHCWVNNEAATFGGMEGYVRKGIASELTKGLEDEGIRGRHWNPFGKFEGRVSTNRLKSYGAWPYWLEVAMTLREPGMSERELFETAADFLLADRSGEGQRASKQYYDKIVKGWAAGEDTGVDLLVPREPPGDLPTRISLRDYPSEPGDAWEPAAAAPSGGDAAAEVPF